MKRFVLFTGFFLLAFTGLSQENGFVKAEETGVRFFGQCMLNLTSENQYVELEASLKSNPNVAIVRLDRISQRAFILSKNLESLTIEQFRSWFGEYGDQISCIQVGKHGFEKIETYPFKNCQN